MKIDNKSHNLTCKSPSLHKTYKPLPLNYLTHYKSNVGFAASADVCTPTLSNSQKLFINIQKPLAYVKGSSNSAKNYNLSKLEGIQKGISVFDGLTLKEINFIGDNLVAICTTRGCYSKCSHCYADAHKPIKEKDDYIYNMLFEDFSSLINGFYELKKRTGLDFIEKNHNSEYIALVFDADDISVLLNDKNGLEHDFAELNNILYKKTGRKSIFDTSGWNVKSKKMQERAEKLVEYYSHGEKIDEVYQFNLSINPFHSIYQKSIELRKNGYDAKANKLYNIYIERMANALLTFSPIIDKPNFGIIARASEYENEYIDKNALSKVLNDVEKLFKQKCIQDFMNNQRYIKSKNRLVDLIQNVELTPTIIDTNILLGKRFSETMEKFPIKNSTYNIYIPYFEKLDIAEHYYNILKKEKHLKQSQRLYGKIIDLNGKVYLSDNYRIIPTDIQLNFINKCKKTDKFHSQVDDFIFTKNMI